MKTLKLFLLSCVFGGVGAFAQCTPSLSAFDAAYLAHQPPAVQALINTLETPSNVAALSQQAASLAAQGYIIDGPIDVWKWDPCLVMSQRVAWGLTWLPNAFQVQILLTPTSNGPVLTIGGSPYSATATPPAGSIIVSTDATSYPPYASPIPTPSAPAICAAPGPPTGGCIDPVGPYDIGNMYYTVTGDNSPNGTSFTDSRGTFTKTVVPTPFGNESWWTLQ